MDWFSFLISNLPLRTNMFKILQQISPCLLLSPFIFISRAFAQSNDSTLYPNCPSYNCSNINISYPFWRLDSTEAASQFCGYEGFGINCSTINGTNIPNINLGGDLYHVQDINYGTSVVSLVDYDVSNIIHVPNDCPRVLHAIDLGTLPFNFSASNVNLSFHYNCTGYPSFANAIPCLDSGTRKASISIMDSEMESFDWSVYSCGEEVVTKVLRKAVYVYDSNQRIDYVRGLRRGFELNWWALEDCRKCEESKGRCGWSYKKGEMVCFCSNGTNECDKGGGNNKILEVVIGVGAPLLSIILIFITCYITKFSPIGYLVAIKFKCDDHMNVEAFIRQYGSLTTLRYTYADVKKMTNSFQVKLGSGGFGIVYQGKLSDGRLVAVKVLNSSKATGKEFINEVASIGKISHINIVSLLGFCSDNHKRALIYEFMPNGSLEKFIHNIHDPHKSSVHLGVTKLYEVVLGIARGLDYMHCECNPRILHLDIKPPNILLDEEFCSKIADFGLAKLYSRNESNVSMLEARGTIGYIAPEVFDRSIGGVSHKSDVYSYGMLILEMVGAKDMEAGVGSKSTSDSYFPYWIYNRLEREEYVFVGDTSAEENEYVRKMTIVGLWCIQTDPTQRPSIDEVIEMLEGSTNALKVPQKPSYQTPVIIYSTSQSEQDDLVNSYGL